MSRSEKLTIAQGICAPLLRKIRADLQRNVDPNSSNDGNGAENEAEDNENEGDHESNVNRLDPRYSSGVSSPGNTISCIKIHLMSLKTTFSLQFSVTFVVLFIHCRSPCSNKALFHL